ncbi:MAG: hypothetical protein ACRC7N_22150 [Clostridium sp.]
MDNLDIEKIIKKYSKNNNEEFTGYLMHRDEKVAEIKKNNLYKVINKELLPIIMIDENVGSFEAWLKTRVIDTHRTNSRQIRKRLSVRTDVANEIVIKAKAVSVTDSYWIKSEEEEISYREIREKLSDGLNKIALYGNCEEIDFNEGDITPELTNIGSFEKCWVLVGDSWFMVKKGSIKENFAEVLVSKIGEYLKFNIVPYEAINKGKLVKVKDFTNGGELDFEPFYSFVKDYWEIDDSVEILNALGYIKEFLDITFLDALCYNIDRHTFNFGVLRKNGKIVALAPNFDNNLALSGVLNDKGLESTWYSTSFTKHNYLPLLKENNYIMPKIDMNEIKVIINDTLVDFDELSKEDVFSEVVYKIIEGNYKLLKDNLKHSNIGYI